MINPDRTRSNTVGQNSIIKGVALIAPFSLLLLTMILFGGPASRFFLGIFSGYEVYKQGPYTILNSEGESSPDWAANTLHQFTTQIVRNFGGQLHIQDPDPNTSGIKIYLLESSDELEKFGLQRMNRDLEHNGGYFLPSKREIALVLTGNREIDQQGLRHEMMHALMYLSRPEVEWPNWFSEGMATFFENSFSDGTDWHPGGLPATSPKKEDPIPLKELLKARGTEFTSEENQRFYQSARLLIEFLFRERRESLFNFYTRIWNEEGDSAFSKSFGDPSDLETEWRTYLKNRK